MAQAPIQFDRASGALVGANAWERLAAVALVLKDQVACRKWPSIALIRGSPCAVTVATVSTFMPVSSATRSAAVRTRSWLMMLRRCSVDDDSERSISSCRAAVSAAVSSTAPP